jgi:hypothetical protein
MKKGPKALFLHHLGNGLADVIDVLAVQSRHAHAAGVGAVHTKL